MADPPSPDSPLESAAETAGARTTEVFSVLGNETRLSILLALWEAYEPFADETSPQAEQATTFEDLQEQIGVEDPDQLTYHLSKLEGPFVDRTELGYKLTNRAEQVLRAVLAGTLTEETSFEGEPIDAPCDHCGAQVVIDYRDTRLIERCTSCEGRWEDPDPVDSEAGSQGVLRNVYRPPAGLENRTPQEFYRHGNTLDRYDAVARLEGICLDCSGAVTTRYSVCEDHDVADGMVCEHCQSFWEITVQTVCEVCKASLQMGPMAPIHTDLRVISFYHDHGIDPHERYDAGDLGKLFDTVDQVSVVSEDPVEVLITIAIDGDRLEMKLDEEANVIDVTEPP